MQSGSKRNKFILWSITAITALVISYPYLVAGVGEEYDFSTVNSELITVTIPVEGMTCEGCNSAVQNAVGKLNGVKAVQANYKTGETKVAFDVRKVTTKEIINSINDIGFSANNPDAQL